MTKSGKAEWRIEYYPKAEKEIRQLGPPVRERIRRAIEQLHENPHQGKPLVGRLQGLRSRRVGDYRIVYLIEEQTDPKRVLILHVGSRGGTYPQVGRRR